MYQDVLSYLFLSNMIIVFDYCHVGGVFSVNVERL